MEQSQFRRRLAVWVGAGAVLAAGTVGVGLYVGVSAAWGLGAILATVYSGTFVFVEQDRIKASQKRDAHGVRAKQVGSYMNPPRQDEFGATPDVPRKDATRHVTAWQTMGKGASYSWHPTLNGIEDVLVAQVSDPSTIVDVIERVGMNPGIVPRGHGSAATLWHGALRSAWMTGREEKICEMVCEANKVAPSLELQAIIDTYCSQSK